jgi:hypothetical protein
MSTFDGGHCFLTTLIPIDSKQTVDRDGLKYSHVQLVREALSVLPTAHQSPETEKLACNSPFSRCTKTHFARIVVLDDVIFNGRTPDNALVTAIEDADPTVPKPVDSLLGPYLLFTADFDAPQGIAAELRDWLRGVWTNMRLDLDPVFEHCFQYRIKVSDADSFADYIMAHQLDTTMPFNDYWMAAPPLPTLSFGLFGGAAIAAGAVTGGASWLLFRLAHLTTLHGIWHGLEIVFVLLLALGAAIYAAYLLVMRTGLKPFPMAPDSDLPSILKALYVQRRLIPKVADLQGKSAQELFDAMGAFLNDVRVDDVRTPTQAPGTIGA